MMRRNVPPQTADARHVAVNQAAHHFVGMLGHQLSVMVVAVVSLGMTPAAPMAMVGVMSPAHKIGCAPAPDLPVENHVMVVPAPLLDGKSRFCPKLVAPPDGVVQPVAPDTRAVEPRA